MRAEIIDDCVSVDVCIRTNSAILLYNFQFITFYYLVAWHTMNSARSGARSSDRTILITPGEGLDPVIPKRVNSC